MKISRQEEHGVRTVLCLARAGRQMTVTEVAQQEGLPEPTTAKVLHRLAQVGVIRAVRGRKGGYELGAAPDEITVQMVLEALGEPLFASRFCGPAAPGKTDADPCPRATNCGLRSVWRHLERRVRQVLEATTIQDIMGAEADATAHVETLWSDETALAKSDRRSMQQ